jgi:uncharacterized membrane protein YgdD (TMEM256/DUF423 family)
MNHRVAMAWAGALGACGVICGSLGAHPIRAALEAAGMRAAWETAVEFQLLHCAALVGLAGWLRAPAPAGRCASWAARLWVAGILLFSGSLYALALGGPRWLGPVTPLGGLCLIAGWILAALSCAAG